MQFDLFDARAPHFATLDDLVAAMMKLEDDPLFPAGTNMVIFRGNPKARLMIIGEAPGTEENRQGKPFVGRSGQLLDQILGSVHLDPEQDVFITNAVFRLPPGDDGKPLRKPTSDEIASSTVWVPTFAFLIFSRSPSCESATSAISLTRP